MNIFAFIPATALTQEDLLNTTAGSGTGQALLVVLSSCLVALAFLAWAAFYYTRRRSRKQRHHHHHHRSSTEQASAPVDESEDSGSHRRRRRKRRREHRPRNPTLAETGGLPPVREEGPPAGL